MVRLIHVIKRNGKFEYRCGEDTGDTYTIIAYTTAGQEIEEPFDELEDAVDHLFSRVKPSAPEDTKARLTRIVEEKRESGSYLDFDRYVETVNRITDPSVARTTFLLGDKEVNVLRKVADYLMKEMTIPMRERHPTYALGEGNTDNGSFELERFEVTIDKLADDRNMPENPHPELNRDEVHALVGAVRYIFWLGNTYHRPE